MIGGTAKAAPAFPPGSQSSGYPAGPTDPQILGAWNQNPHAWSYGRYGDKGKGYGPSSGSSDWWRGPNGYSRYEGTFRLPEDILKNYITRGCYRSEP